MKIKAQYAQLMQILENGMYMFILKKKSLRISILPPSPAVIFIKGWMKFCGNNCGTLPFINRGCLHAQPGT